MPIHRVLAAIAAAILGAAPALAQGPAPIAPPTTTMVYPGHWGGPFGLWYGGWQPEMVVNVPNQTTAPGQPQWQGQAGYDHEGWLRECRHRLGDNGMAGAVIGGALGGVAGHEIAGAGRRTLGTVAGAVAGAAAGSAIARAEDRPRVQDRCEAMLANPPAGYSYGGYGYGMPVMLVPVLFVPAPGQPAPATRPCKKTVVTEEFYETAPVRSRHIAPRRAPQKHLRMAPDKRVPQ